MKYSLHCNQKQALSLGVNNINQALILDLLSASSSWCEHVHFEGQVFYWVSRQRICKELPILNLKPDTVYRHLKNLQELGVIDYQKDGKKDLVKLTNKGKKYYIGNESENEEITISEMNPIHYVGNESELRQNSEMNPKKLGNESEKHSEINPTYKTTKKHISSTSYQKKNKQKEKTKKISPSPGQPKFEIPDFINPELWAEWLVVRKQKKAVNSPTALKGLVTAITKCQKIGIDPTEAMTIAIEQSWKSIQPEWIENLRNQKNQSGTFSHASNTKHQPQAIDETGTDEYWDCVARA